MAENVWEDVSPAELVAKGLIPPGPLAPAIKSNNPEVNAQAIREFVNPKPPSVWEQFYKPGIAAKVGSTLSQAPYTKNFYPGPMTPQQIYDQGTPKLENLAALLGSLVMPGRTMGQRMLGAALPAAGVSALGGHGASGAAGAAAGPGALQLGAEGIAGIFRQYKLGKVAKGLMKDLAGTKLQAAEDAARKMMDSIKEAVPQWKGIESTVGGLIDTLIGKGQSLVSDAYDAAMKAALAQAKGMTVSIPVLDAGKLGLNKPQLPAGIKQATVFRGDPIRPDLDLSHVDVNAADLIEKITNPVKRDWGVYRRAVDALDAQGLGIPEDIRSAYRSSQGFIEALDTAKVLQMDDLGKRTFVPENLVSATNDVANIDLLRRRGMGNALSSPIVQAAEEASALRNMPPPELDAITQPINQNVGRILGGLIGGGVGLASGHPYLGPTMGGIGGAAMGGVAAKMLPEKLYKSVPGTEGLELLLGELAKTAPVAARAAFQATPASADTSVDAIRPEDLAEILAAQQSGQTALTDPRLSLETHPIYGSGSAE